VSLLVVYAIWKTATDRFLCVHAVDAAAWGYRYSAEAKKYVVNEKTGEDTAFQLWMVGSVGNYGRAFSLNVNLTDVVRIFTGPGQREYNDLMMRSDILLPAFLEPGWGCMSPASRRHIMQVYLTIFPEIWTVLRAAPYNALSNSTYLVWRQLSFSKPTPSSTRTLQ
jgi:hypothetical protein